MIKKIFLYFFLFFFTTTITAEEIIMKCKFKKYKYITQNSGDIILSTKKRGVEKWTEWCPGKKTEDNKSWFVSAKNQKLVVQNLRGTCMVERGEFLMKGGKTGFIRLSKSSTDFKKFIYTTEFFWMNEKRKRKRKEKCKILKKL